MRESIPRLATVSQEIYISLDLDDYPVLRESERVLEPGRVDLILP